VIVRPTVAMALASSVASACGDLDPTSSPNLTIASTPPSRCHGEPRGPSGVVAQQDIGDLWAVIQDTEVGFPTAVGVVGDVNGDGCDDLAWAGNRGLSVLFGPIGPGTWSVEEADLTLPNEHTAWLSRAGDVDRDGRDELWLSARLVKFDGVSLAVLSSFTQPALPVSGDFDADGDGEVDAFIPSFGKVMLVYGPLASWGTVELFDAEPLPLVDMALFDDPGGRDWGSSPLWWATWTVTAAASSSSAASPIPRRSTMRAVTNGVRS
jgi:hypothetical protein